eukprot:5000388-Ditylum_brightwellii.AAC.1
MVVVVTTATGNTTTMLYSAAGRMVLHVHITINMLPARIPKKGTRKKQRSGTAWAAAPGESGNKGDQT